MSAFRVEISEDPRGLIVRLGGSLAVTEVDGFITSVDDIIARKPKIVVLHMAELGYCDSTMLGIFVRLTRGVSQGGGQVRLAAPPANIRKLIESMRMHKAMPMFESVDAALG